MVATKTEKIIDIGKGKRAMRLISVDAGNFEIKACSGKEPIAIRSIFKKLPSSANLPRCNDVSPVVELPNSDFHLLKSLNSIIDVFDCRLRIFNLTGHSDLSANPRDICLTNVLKRFTVRTCETLSRSNPEEC